MVRVYSNVGGVPGLDLALDCFSEETERRLFQNTILFPSADAVSGQRNYRHGTPTGPQLWDKDIWEAVRLLPQVFPQVDVPPDYCLALSYPKGAGFQHHFDSRYRWGEAIVAVNLGNSCVLYVQPSKKQLKERGPPQASIPDELNVTVKKYPSGNYAVEVVIPRRSIYVMHGEVRLDWKHGIRKQSQQLLQTYPPSSHWNVHQIRRSLTLRATKAYSDAYLQHFLSQDPTNAILKERIKSQNKFRPEQEGGRLNNAELEKERAQAQRTLQYVLQRYDSPQAGQDRDTLLHQWVDGDSVVAVTVPRGTGLGHLLGSSQDQDDDAQLQAAIRLSLQEQHSPSPEKKSGGSANEPICLDDGDKDKKEMSSPTTTRSSPTRGIKRHAPTEAVASPTQEDKERMRLARLARFEAAASDEKKGE